MEPWSSGTQSNHSSTELHHSFTELSYGARHCLKTSTGSQGMRLAGLITSSLLFCFFFFIEMPFMFFCSNYICLCLIALRIFPCLLLLHDICRTACWITTPFQDLLTPLFFSCSLWFIPRTKKAFNHLDTEWHSQFWKTAHRHISLYFW